MGENEKKYKKEAYDVNVNEVIKLIKFKVDELDMIQVSSIKIHDIFNAVKKNVLRLRIESDDENPYLIIEYPHVSFIYWLGLFLSSLKDSSKIPLILDHHFEIAIATRNPTEVINTIEFDLKTQVESNAFFDVKDHLKEIVAWLREKKKEFRERSNEETSLGFKDSFIKAPFNELLFTALKPFCVSSLDDLKSLIDKNESQKVIIFSQGLKKSHLTFCLHSLSMKGSLNFNNNQLSEWMEKHFAIRKNSSELNYFKASSCLRYMGYPESKKVNCQIKYEDWKN